MKQFLIFAGISMVLYFLFLKMGKPKGLTLEEQGYVPLGKVTFKKFQNNILVVPAGHSEYDTNTKIFSSAKFRVNHKLIGSENIEGYVTELYVINSKFYNGNYKVVSWNGTKPITNFTLKPQQIKFKGNDEGKLYIRNMKNLQLLQEDPNLYYVPYPHEHDTPPGQYMAKHEHGIYREYIP